MIHVGVCSTLQIQQPTTEPQQNLSICTHLPLRSDGVPFAGDSLERSYLFYDRPSRLSSNAPACRGQSRLSDFCCAHRLCVRSPCQHISRMRTFDNNSCAISITSPRSLFRPPNPTWSVGSPGEVPASVHTMGLPGKVLPSGTFPLSGTPSERRVRRATGIVHGLLYHLNQERDLNEGQI